MGIKGWVGKKENVGGNVLERLPLEKPPWEVGGHRSFSRALLGVCLDATPGAFIHDPSAEEVFQPLIQAGGHSVLLTGPRYWCLLGGKSCRIYYLGEEALLPSIPGQPPGT